MQFVKALKSSILKPLQVVCGVVDRKQSYPILSNVLISKQGTDVSFLSTDLEIQTISHASAGIESDNIQTTVGARKLFDILRSLPDSAEVTFTLDEQRLIVSVGKSTRFSLQTLSADDFPKMPENTDSSSTFSISQKALKKLFQEVSFAMAQQDVRYFLNGLLIQVQQGVMKAVATDGHRLTYSQTQLEHTESIPDFIIPRKTVLELERILEDKDDLVELTVSPTQIKFVFGEIELISKLVEGKFPDYTRVIPKGYVNKFSINRTVLQEALQRAAIMTSDKLRSVKCLLRENTFKVRSNNSDNEEAVEELEIEYHGADIDIGFNVNYLLDVVGILKSEMISIELGDEKTSVLISNPDSTEFKYVLMPVRI